MASNIDQARRKRINLYKKIIVIMVVAMILLPTILCIILFIKLNLMEGQINELKTSVAQLSVRNTDSAHASVEPGKINETDDNESGSDVIETGDFTVSLDETVTQTGETSTIAETTEEVTTAATGQSEQEMVDKALAEGRKVVYLTFDDGPCANTIPLLDVLDEYGVKVTFFVNYHSGREEEYRQIVERGHSLAMHTYSHVYENVYGSYDQFVNEVAGIRNYIKDITGVDSTLFRFPGGSSNSMTSLPISTFIAYLNEENIHYFDWNVSSGDGGEVTRQQAYDNVMNGIYAHDVSVVLMHDSEYKLTTFEAVPDILKTLQEMNALILPISMDTTPVQHRVQ